MIRAVRAAGIIVRGACLEITLREYEFADGEPVRRAKRRRKIFICRKRALPDVREYLCRLHAGTRWSCRCVAQPCECTSGHTHHAERNIEVASQGLAQC
jgi:hypothetical protein